MGASVPEGAIKVMVEGGRITLSSAVDSHDQKQAASDAVRSLIGVKDVSDRIAIKPTVMMSAVKAGIAAALNRRASRDANFGQVDGAVVTPTGTVNSYADRELASNSAWGRPAFATSWTT